MARFPGLGSLLVAGATLLFGCAEPRTVGGVPSASRAAHTARSQTEKAPAPAPAPGEAWVAAVRIGDHREAARCIDALPADVARRPEVRFVRARAALGLGEFEQGRKLLDGLERELPLLSEEVVDARAACSLAVGPFDEAARYFGARAEAASLLKAGLAWERAGDLVRARAALDGAVRAAKSEKEREAFPTLIKARSARARIAGLQGDRSMRAADLRFLFVEAPASAAARDARSEIQKLVPPLTVDERVSLAKRLAEAGRSDEALTVLTELEAGSPGSVTKAALARARAWVFYLSRADYARAAELFAEASRADPKERVRDLFYAAKALSRAQKDELAIARYRDLVRQYPTSGFAEEAQYQATRLEFLLGKWDPAIQGYRSYLALFGKKKKGRFSEAAEGELALALLSAKRPGEAVPLFRKLADGETDAAQRAVLRELEGAALADAGQKERAVECFNSVIRERPFSFPALVGASRLADLGHDVPKVVLDAALSRPKPVGVVLPEKVELLARLGFLLDAERTLRRHEAELTLRYAPRGNEALCEAYGRIGAGAERYRVGRAVVKGEALERVPTDETRWAWECVYPTPFEEVVRGAETLRGLPPGLLHAVMRQESAFRADAVSPANAVGLLQLIPGTAERVAKEMGTDHDAELLRVPSRNVELGAFYLRKVLDRFGGHVALAAAAYNAGPQAVSRWLETGEDLPLDVWVARIPYAETRGYVVRVVGNLARYSFLRGGEGAVPRIALALPRGVRAGAEDY